MSYRAFKRLLGETSLERKCRFLFGGFILLLITLSFWFYLRQTEHLAYDQILTSSRLLMIQIVDKEITTNCWPDQRQGESKEATAALEEFNAQWQQPWPEWLKKYYQARVILPKHRVTRPDNQADDAASITLLQEFQKNKDRNEDNQLILEGDRGRNQYYGAVRATKSCLGCHRRFDPELAEGDLIALIRIQVPTDAIREGIDLNRAVLLSTAFITAVLVMLGSYVIVRYVIVKPVKHLKEVSDAISAGELNVRSEIQTGDEFEDLSHAFNRMLRNLVSMQDRLRKVNTDLDRKVDELAQANLALFETNQLKSDFLATVSHELKTPLNSILGFSEVLHRPPPSMRSSCAGSETSAPAASSF